MQVDVHQAMSPSFNVTQTRKTSRTYWCPSAWGMTSRMTSRTSRWVWNWGCESRFRTTCSKLIGLKHLLSHIIKKFSNSSSSTDATQPPCIEITIIFKLNKVHFCLHRANRTFPCPTAWGTTATTTNRIRCTSWVCWSNTLKTFEDVKVGEG